MSAPIEKSEAAVRSRWWGTFDVAPDAPRMWRIGPLDLTVERRRGEWRLRAIRDDDDAGGATVVHAPAERLSDEFDENVARFAVSGESTKITITPVLADLPVVSRPENSLTIPAGEETTLYVGSPVRALLSSDTRPLVELAVDDPRKAWFGSYDEGEVAYASRSFCRMNADELTHRPHRATTAVTIQNDGETDLSVVRILLPVGHLSLSLGSDGHLWTEDVHLVRSNDDELAQLELRPREWRRSREDVELLSGPRLVDAASPLVRVFSPLLPR